MQLCYPRAIQEIQDGVKDGFQNRFAAIMVVIMIYLCANYYSNSVLASKYT